MAVHAFRRTNELMASSGWRVSA